MLSIFGRQMEGSFAILISNVDITFEFNQALQRLQLAITRCNMYSSPAIFINTINFEILKLLKYFIRISYFGNVYLLPVDKYQLFPSGLELQHSAGRKDHFYSLIQLKHLLLLKLKAQTRDQTRLTKVKHSFRIYPKHKIKYQCNTSKFKPWHLFEPPSESVLSMQLYYCFPQPSEGPSGHKHSGRLRPRVDIHQHPVRAQQSHRHMFLEFQYQNSNNVYCVNKPDG